MSIRKQDDGRYLLDIRPHGRRGIRVRKVFDKKSIAIATERYIMANAEKREYIQGYRDRRTLGDLLDQWWIYHGQHRRKADDDKRQLKSIITELGIDSLAVELDKLKIIAWRSQKIGEGLKSSSVNRYINRLSGMFTVLAKIGVWDNDHPVRGISRLYVKSSEMAFLSKKETAALLAALEGDYYRVALLCLSTGARWGEASVLKGEQVIHNRVTFLETKNGKKRTVPISQAVCDVIKTRETGPLFNVKYHLFCQMLKKVKPDLPKGQAAHVLRHTFASHFVMTGGNIIALQRILGHATIQQTMTYAHFAPDYLADAMKFNPVAGISLALP
ncbi:tyrosine-type recombinase/integrase [Salmonella enterica]|nr:tyrosine-type recombinase/integrase [Salmonella enterica]EGY4503671.1 tyrosine-type recombinase/integrase [Salmonella enterica]EGY4511748.1 tyrosine-type recombinase/integrase [Salmonella enterica]EGY4702462.1 tyrosine-type recombinase/integrase [Salmonella enterica]EHG4022483.1 tyrosine-type recombinase/integrase [Salmonella enterica]